MPFVFVLPSPPELVFDHDKKEQLERLMHQFLYGDDPTDKSDFIPLSPQDPNIPILTFLKTLSGTAEILDFSEEQALRLQYETVFSDSKNLQLLLQLMTQIRIQAVYTQKPETPEAQVEYIKGLHKKLHFMVRIIAVLRDKFYYTPEVMIERCEVLKGIFKDSSLNLRNISEGLYGGAFLSHSEELVDYFEKESSLLMEQLLVPLKFQLQSASTDEIDELVPLIEYIMLFCKQKSALKAAQGLSQEAILAFSQGLNHLISMRYLFQFLDKKNPPSSKYVDLYEKMRSAAHAEYMQLQKDNSLNIKRQCYTTIFEETDCFSQPPVSYDVSVHKPTLNLQEMVKTLSPIKAVTPKSLGPIQNAIKLLHYMNMVHYEASIDKANMCQVGVEHLQRILANEHKTLLTQTIQLRLVEHLGSLQGHKIAINMRLAQLLKEGYEKAVAPLITVVTECQGLLTSLQHPKTYEKTAKMKAQPSLSDHEKAVNKKYEAAEQEIALLQKEITILKGKAQSVRDDKAHQVKLYKQLEQECASLKAQWDKAPKSLDLESSLGQAQEKQSEIQQKVDALEQFHHQQQSVYKAQMSEQEKTHKQIVSNTLAKVKPLEKQIEKAKKENNRLKNSSLKQTQGNLALKKQAADYLETQGASHNQEVEGFKQEIAALEAQILALKAKASSTQPSQQVQKKFQDWHQRYIQEYALNQVYAAQYAQMYQNAVVSGACIYNLTSQLGAINELSIKLSDAPALEFTGDLIGSLKANPLLVVRLLLISVQHNKFFTSEHSIAISEAISQCLKKGLQGYLALLTVITEYTVPCMSFQFLYQRHVFPHMIPLLWPEDNAFMQEWFNFVFMQLGKADVRDPFVLLNCLMLAPYQAFKNQLPSTPQDKLIDNISERLLAQISNFKPNEKKAFKNCLIQGLPPLIKAFSAWQKEEKNLEAIAPPVLSVATKPPAIVFSRVVNFNPSHPEFSQEEKRSAVAF